MLINCTGVLVALWAWFQPEPYKYVMLACLILPLISIAVLKFYKGLIRIDQKKNSPYPTIFWSFFASSSALSVRSLLDFNIFDHSNIWIPSVATLLFLLTIIMLGSKEFSFKKTEDYFTIFNLILFLFAYGYGATITLNCIYDQSTAKSFDSSVLHKRISTGKTTSYYLELSPWNNQVESAEETVSKEFYDSIDQSQTVKIEFHEGLLKIPWFVITK